MCRITSKLKRVDGYVLVPVRFIDEIMPSTSESFLKIYLYLHRFSLENREITIAELTGTMDCTEGDLHRALVYWTKRDVLSYRVTQDGILDEIILLDMYEGEPGEEEAIVEKLITKLEYESRESLPEYTKNTVEKVASMFPEDLAVYLLLYCFKRVRVISPEYCYFVRKTAETWQRKGISTVADAEKEVARRYDAIQLLLEVMNLERLSAQQLQLVNQWIDDWDFSNEMIAEACNRAAKKLGGGPEYCHKILNAWQQKEIDTLEKVKKDDAAFGERQKTTSKKKKSPASAGNSFTDYEQRDYSAEEWAEILRIMQERE